MIVQKVCVCGSFEQMVLAFDFGHIYLRELIQQIFAMSFDDIGALGEVSVPVDCSRQESNRVDREE